MTIITGQRGVGKTTTIAQYMSKSPLKSLYISMDSFIVGDLTMFEIAEQFEIQGGQLLCFDEIHKYPNWSQELKSIYDTFLNVQVIVSGSSALEINKGSHDLSRRAHLLKMYGMSFREFLEVNLNIKFNKVSLEELLGNHQNLALTIAAKTDNLDKKILSLFSRYLKIGYYPYFLEIDDDTVCCDLLKQNIDATISSDLLFVYPSLDGSSIRKLKLLVSIIMESVPFIPVLEKLKVSLDVGDSRTLKDYFIKLEDAGILSLLMKSSSKGLAKLEKPEKIYLENTNLLQVLNSEIEIVRETFFLNTVKLKYKVTCPKKGDFLVDNKYLFEVGGTKKALSKSKI